MSRRGGALKIAIMPRSNRLAVALAIALTACAAPAARAEQPLPHSSDPTTWTTNDDVYAIATIADTTYIAGNFAYVGPRTGAGFLVAPQTGARDESPQIVGRVTASAPDGAGGVFIAGMLGAVHGVAVGAIAHLLPDGSVDPQFVAPKFGGGGANSYYDVATMLVVGDRLYVGGTFLEVGGAPRVALVALDKLTGKVLGPAYDVRNNADPGRVWDLAAGPGGTVYVGGDFDKVGAATYPNLVRLDATGAVVPAVFPGGEPDGPVRALEVAGGHLYVGGEFDKLGASVGGNLRRYSATGVIDIGWTPSPDGTVRSLDVAGDSVYLVGTFEKIAGVQRHGAGAVETSNAAVRPWNPAPVGNIWGGATPELNAVHVTDSKAFIGGDLAFAGGQPRDGLAAVDLASGAALAPSISVGGAVNTISATGGRLFVGGNFISVGGVRRRGLAAIGPDGKATAWNPTVQGIVRALVASPDGQRLYAGGTFSDIGGAARSHLAALSPASNSALAFDPGPNSLVRSLALSPDGATLFVAGDFTSIGQGTPAARNYLAALDAATGAATTWDPKPDALVQGLTQGPGGSPLYVRGAFDHIGSQAQQPQRKGVAALEPASAKASDFSPSVLGGGIQAMLATPGAIYLAGAFDEVQGVQRRAFAAVAPDGALTGFDAKVQKNYYAGWALARAGGGTLIIGGIFDGLGSSDRRRLAEVDPLTGVPTTWHPTLLAGVNGLHVDGRNLWVLGGGADGVRPGGYLHRYVRPAEPADASPPAAAEAAPAPAGEAGLDSVAPSIVDAWLTRRAFSVARRPTALSAGANRRPARGTTLRVNLDEQASLVVRVQRRRRGRRVGARCLPDRKRLATHKPCTRFTRVGALRRAAVAPKASIRFSGRLGSKALAPARYRFSIVAADAAGNRSTATRVAFRVLKG